MFFDAPNCQGATLATGKRYNADKQGIIHVDSTSDAKALKAAGYMVAGGMPKVSKYYECECGWQASIRHCPKCERDDLRKVEK
jgi:hypothetical protein